VKLHKIANSETLQKVLTDAAEYAWEYVTNGLLPSYQSYQGSSINKSEAEFQSIKELTQIQLLASFYINGLEELKASATNQLKSILKDQPPADISRQSLGVPSYIMVKKFDAIDYKKVVETAKARGVELDTLSKKVNLVDPKKTDELIMLLKERAIDATPFLKSELDPELIEKFAQTHNINITSLKKDSYSIHPQKPKSKKGAQEYEQTLSGHIDNIESLKAKLKSLAVNSLVQKDEAASDVAKPVLDSAATPTMT